MLEIYIRKRRAPKRVYLFIVIVGVVLLCLITWGYYILNTADPLRAAYDSNALYYLSIQTKRESDYSAVRTALDSLPLELKQLLNIIKSDNQVWGLTGFYNKEQAGTNHFVLLPASETNQVFLHTNNTPFLVYKNVLVIAADTTSLNSWPTDIISDKRYKKFSQAARLGGKRLVYGAVFSQGEQLYLYGFINKVQNLQIKLQTAESEVNWFSFGPFAKQIKAAWSEGMELDSDLMVFKIKDFSKLLELSPYADDYQIWQQLTGKIELLSETLEPIIVSDQDNFAFILGQKLPESDLETVIKDLQLFLAIHDVSLTTNLLPDNTWQQQWILKPEAINKISENGYYKLTNTELESNLSLFISNESEFIVSNNVDFMAKAQQVYQQRGDNLEQIQSDLFMYLQADQILQLQQKQANEYDLLLCISCGK